jgi:hypothetical protein
VPHITRLAQLAGGGGGCSTGQGAQQPAGTAECSGQPQQRAAATTKECLLAIGDHIEGGACWMAPYFPAADAWRVVVGATGHRMGPEQLAGLYRGIKAQREREAPQGAGGGVGNGLQQAGMLLSVQKYCVARSVCPPLVAWGHGCDGRTPCNLRLRQMI